MTEETGPWFIKLYNTLYDVFVKPVEYFREKVVEPNQQKYPWYHKKFRRVPTIDECYEDDIVCTFEAQYQYLRDREVDLSILAILRQRHQDCFLWNFEDPHVCDYLDDALEDASTNWNIKHGDLSGYPHVREAFMKQKHRMVWERRHGPVGTGMKDSKKTQNE
ncbi:NADH dehydrogenase [ubiquinone] 1 beta subcomplex subunit 10 [Chelonus insularis]|uniref:NADH dehydrogenase [ubiquinone] 1 beta subcomplex subunit 10 n=1 Tax=Chelonus insularis TaxID=460826 RepID=UPI00158B7C82|nr:NADH dehydrogenase [ubiquinone] 1 beta subcomplex subunit 10 [Chelonus insularis]